MKISELVDRTDIPLTTVKYYIRAGLLAPGKSTSRTRAEYNESHVDRLTLIKVLQETAGLSLDRIKIVLEQVDDPNRDQVTALGTAMAALPPYVRPRSEHPEVSRLIQTLGWASAPGHPVMDQLEDAIAACAAAGLPLTMDILVSYARAMLGVARIDVALLPDNRSDAIRTAVIGTAVGDVLLVALRRIAQLNLILPTGNRNVSS